MHSQTHRAPASPDRFESPHARWIALTHRAPSSHSSFLYGVKSTRIYCRPTCSARLARRANVVFYDTETQARRDGFRPCKRCKPDNTTFIGEAEEVVTRALALLRTKNDDLTMKRGLKELAKEVGITPSYLCRVFKKTMGVTVGVYMKEFEREAIESETESSVKPPGMAESEPVDMGVELLTPNAAPKCHPAPVEGWKGGLAQENIGEYVEESLDLDLNFNDWFWTGDFSSDEIYDGAI